MGIKRARLLAGLTQTQLAERMGVEQGTIARWESSHRNVDISKLRRLAEILDVSLAELMDEKVPTSIADGKSNPEQARGWPAEAVGTMPRDFPVVGSALAADLVLNGDGATIAVEQVELTISDVIEHVRRPLAFQDNGLAYGIYVEGSSMQPRYDPGDLVYVDPRRPPAIGDDVVVQLRNGSGHDGEDVVVCAVIKRLVRRSSTMIKLEQYNPALQFELPIERVAQVHRVVRMGELMGI